jgi:putative transposase
LLALEPIGLSVLIPRKESNAMTRISTDGAVYTSSAVDAVGNAFEEASASFERFCLAAGIEALGAMMEKDAEGRCEPQYCCSTGERAYRRGRTSGTIGFHGGEIDIKRGARARQQGIGAAELEQGAAEDCLGEWAMNQMLLNVSTRKFLRSVRLPRGDVPAPAGAGCRNQLPPGSLRRCRLNA